MMSIRWRLTALLCLAVGALIISAGFGVFAAMRDLLLSRFDETLAAKGRALITASEIDDGDFEIDLTVQDFAGFGRAGDDYFEIRRLNGSTFLRSPSLIGLPAGANRLGTVRPPRSDAATIEDGWLMDGRPARFYVQIIYPKDDAKERYQDLYLIVASPTRGIRTELHLLATVLAVTGGAVLLLMIPIIRLALGRGLTPLFHLADEISRIPPEGLGRKLRTAHLPPELKPVATGLNAWLARLSESFERERRFTSHAAHELRTPLAELRSIAELGAMHPDEATPERCAEIVTVSEELGSLLEKLALLARADAGRQPVRPAPVDLRKSISQIIAKLEPRASERGIRFDCHISPDTIRTDPILWNTILQNLLGNSVSHGPVGSVVVVRASASALKVRNPAPHLVEADLPRLFERFWSSDESRNSRDHSGLGLSLVRACATLLGGECGATLGPQKELEITVSLPSSRER